MTDAGATDSAGVTRAIESLSAGGLAVLPTETLYGVFADARSANAMKQLRSAREAAGAVGDAPFTWHSASVGAVMELLTHEVHRHIASKVLPGPVRLLIELDAAALAKLPAGLVGVVDSAADGDAATRVVSVRVPGDANFASVAQRCATLVGERVGLIGLGDGKALSSDARAVAARSGVQAVLDVGPTQFGAPSSTVRLTRSGWYKIESTGAWSERTLRAKFETQVLFVCTGNTCRSPMAEAIARHYLAKPGATKKPTRVASAGVATGDGMAMTDEAKEALERLQIDPGRHRSRMLTREMVEDATVIYAMTRSHAQQAIALVPSAKDKVQVLDPSGRDIADPIGSSLATYVQTAEAIAGFIRTRLTADGTLTLPRKKGILEPG